MERNQRKSPGKILSCQTPSSRFRESSRFLFRINISDLAGDSSMPPTLREPNNTATSILTDSSPLCALLRRLPDNKWNDEDRNSHHLWHGSGEQEVRGRGKGYHQLSSFLSPSKERSVKRDRWATCQSRLALRNVHGRLLLLLLLPLRHHHHHQVLPLLHGIVHRLLNCSRSSRGWH